MKLTLDTGIKCPYCKKYVDIETGFWGALLVDSVLDRIKREGATITCPHCKRKFHTERF